MVGTQQKMQDQPRKDSVELRKRWPPPTKKKLAHHEKTVHSINWKEPGLCATKIIKVTKTDANFLMMPTLFWSFGNERILVRENVQTRKA